MLCFPKRYQLRWELVLRTHKKTIYLWCSSCIYIVIDFIDNLHLMRGRFVWCWSCGSHLKSVKPAQFKMPKIQSKRLFRTHIITIFYGAQAAHTLQSTLSLTYTSCGDVAIPEITVSTAWLPGKGHCHGLFRKITYHTTTYKSDFLAGYGYQNPGVYKRDTSALIGWRYNS